MAFKDIGDGLLAQISKVPSEEDYCFVQGLESRVPVKKLVALAMFVLTNSSLKEDDSLLGFVENVRRLRLVVDEGGKLRFELPI